MKEKTKFKIASIVIVEIGVGEEFLNIGMRIGTKTFSETISLKKNIYLYAANLKGVICHIEIMDIKYTLFITSSSIDEVISKYQEVNKVEEFPNTFNDGLWFIEFVKTFNDNTIYFIRSVDEDSDEEKEKKLVDNTDIIFKGFFHTSPNEIISVRKFILLEFLSSYPLLIEIKNERVRIKKIKYDMDILIGKFSKEEMDSIAYIIQIKDLIKVQLKNGFKKVPLFFYYENFKLPIPAIPFLNNKNSDENNFFYTLISRSQLLCVSVTKLLNKNNKCYNFIDYNELIAISDKHFKGIEPRVLKIYFKKNQVISDKPINDSDQNLFAEKNTNLMPYKYLAYPYNINDSNLKGNNYGFFLELPDYHKYIEDEEYGFIYDNPPDYDEEESIYPEGWEDLDLDEKYAIDCDLAEDELLARVDEHYLAKDEEYYMDNFPYREYEPNDEYFYSEKDELLRIISNISCVSLSDQTATFELIRDEYYQNIICPIIKNPFIKGLLIYSGILSLHSIGQIQFIITEKCKKKFLKKILSEVMNYNEYIVVTSNNFHICFNCELKDNYKDSIISDELNPTRVFLDPF